MQSIPQLPSPSDDYLDIIEHTVERLRLDVDNLFRQLHNYEGIFGGTVSEDLVKTITRDVFDRLADGMRDYDPGYLATIEAIEEEHAAAQAREQAERHQAYIEFLHYGREMADMGE